MRQRIGHNKQGRRLKNLGFEKQVGQRRREEHQTRQTIEEMQHGIQVAKPLPKAKAFAKQRVISTKDLCHSPCPANTLADMPRQTLSGQASRLRNSQVSRVIAQAIELQGCMCIFGHRLNGDPTNLFQRPTLDDGARATEECRIPQVIAVLNQPIEQLAFVRY